MNTSTNKDSIAREVPSITAKLIGLAAMVFVIVTLGLYKFFEWLVPDSSRLVWLVLLSWFVIIAFLFGLVIGGMYARGFRSGHEHSAQVVTGATLPTAAPPSPTTIIDYSRQWPDEPREFGFDEAAAILKQLEEAKS